MTEQKKARQGFGESLAQLVLYTTKKKH